MEAGGFRMTRCWRVRNRPVHRVALVRASHERQSPHDSNHPGCMKPGQDPSWSHYGDTLIELFDDGSLVLDVRAPIPKRKQQALNASVLGDEFAILTAYNPHGRDHSAADNADRDRRLRADLTARGLTWVRADGWAPDRSHREPGVAVVADRVTAQQIGREYEQSAIYWYADGVIWLVGALVEAAPEQLPRVRTDPPE